MTNINTVPLPVANGGLRMSGYDAADDMLKVKSIQKKWRDNFPGSALDSTRWEAPSIVNGGFITVSAGTLVMNSGTTANGVTSITSVETFTTPFRFSFSLSLTQRIANQELFIEAISVNPTTGIPDGLHSIAWLFNGTSATQAVYQVQNGGMARLWSAPNAIQTTAGGSIYEIESFSDEVWFHSGLMDSQNGRANSYRRHTQIPDPNAVFKIRIRWVNGATAPASATSAVFQFINVQDYAELTAEITAGRGQSVAGQAIGVMPAATFPVSGTVVANQGTPFNSTPSIINSAATTNATLLKATAGNVYSLTASNISASPRFLKLFNLTVAPTVGTSVPALTIPIPANSTVNLNFGVYGIRFAAGISLAITAGAADNDTAVIGASEVKSFISFV